MVEKDNPTTANLGSLLVFRWSQPGVPGRLIWNYFGWVILFQSTVVCFLTTKRYHVQQYRYVTDFVPNHSRTHTNPLGGQKAAKLRFLVQSYDGLAAVRANEMGVACWLTDPLFSGFCKEF